MKKYKRFSKFWYLSIFSKLKNPRNIRNRLKKFGDDKIKQSKKESRLTFKPSFESSEG